MSSGRNPAAVLAGVAVCLLALLTIFYARRLWQAAHVGDTDIGADFAGFYSAGMVYRSRGNPYDGAVYEQALHRLRPTMRENQILPFLYPPPLLWLFGLLARLPYVWAFATWLLISTALYGVALWLLWREYLPQIPFWWYAAPALLFQPFLNTISDGQLGALGCLSLVGFVVGTERKYDRMAGASLALYAFKPTMLILPASALLFTRRWRTLGYLGLGCAAFVLLSLVTGRHCMRIIYVHCWTLHDRQAPARTSCSFITTLTLVHSSLLGVSGRDPLCCSSASA